MFDYEGRAEVGSIVLITDTLDERANRNHCKSKLPVGGVYTVAHATIIGGVRIAGDPERACPYFGRGSYKVVTL